MPARQLPDGIRAARVLDERTSCSPGRATRSPTPARSRPPSSPGTGSGCPASSPGTEWAAYYDELAAAFGLTIDVTGPDFGTESLLDVIADSAELATLVGEQTRLLWPADYDLRRIAVRDPTPVYPHSLIWRGDNPHPALATLRTYLGSVQPGHRDAGTWAPSWTRRLTSG